MSDRFDIAGEKLRIRQEIEEGRRDLRNNTVPYFDVHGFEVQHYSDLANGLIKLLKNSVYLIDEIYYRVPTSFRFYTRTQYCRFDDGTVSAPGEWELQDTRVVAKNEPLVGLPSPMDYQGHQFSAWATDPACSSAVDFSVAVGPISAYASYNIKDYQLHFQDYYRNDVSNVLCIADISDCLVVSAFSDVKSRFSPAVTKAIARKIDDTNRERYPDLSNYWLYKFDGDYPNALSNVRDDMHFKGVYTYVKDPAYLVRNYYNAYDGKKHCISVEFAEGTDRYYVAYSSTSAGPFGPQNISVDYTADEVQTVYFKISAYSDVLDEYKPCGGLNSGTIRIYKQYMLQEENRKYVLTQDSLSILI